MGHIVVRNGDPEAAAEFTQLFLVQLFLLVRDVPPLARFAHPVPFDRFGQDHRGPADRFGRRLEGGINLFRIVPAAAHAFQLFVRVLFDHLQQLGILAKEVFADVLAARHGVLLVFAVDHFHHPLSQHAFLVLGQQRVPVVAPDDLDHVPAGAAEDRLQLLDDLAVAADRAVQALEVAVDDEDQVVQLFAGGQGDGSQGFRFVAFPVSQKSPHLAAGRIEDAAIAEVFVEPRLVDGHDRGQAHGDGRELPEVGHQPGMGIGGEAGACRQLAAEVDQVFFGQPAFQKGPSVDAGRRVPLEVNLVPREIAVAAKEMMETDFVQGGRGGVGRDVTADAGKVAIGPHDHRHRVPADDALDPPLDLPVARINRLLVDRDRIDVGRVGRKRQLDALLMSVLVQHRQQILHALRTFALQHIFQRIEPLTRFRRIDVAAGGLLDVNLGCHPHGSLPDSPEHHPSLLFSATRRQR